MNDGKKQKESSIGTHAGTLTEAKPKKKKKKVLIIVLAIVVVLAVIIGIMIKNMTKQVEMVGNLVQVEPVQVRDLSDTISLKGTIEGESRTNIVSKAVSEVMAVNVRVGDIVKEGDVLCTLDSASIQEQISELEKNLSNSKAVNNINSQQNQTSVNQAIQDQQTQLDEAQKAITVAEENYNAAEIMYDRGESDFSALLSAQRAVETAKENYDKVVESTNRAIESAKIAVQLDQYKTSDTTTSDTLSDLRKQLEDCEIKAPNGGVVTAVNISVGDMNTAKATMITIEDTSTLKVAATVNESDILKIEEGMKAIITTDATGEEELTGTVTRVVRVKNQTGDGSIGGNGNVSSGYSIEITIDSKDLLVGMAAKVKLMIQEKGEVMAIPYDLIQYDENGAAFVLVAEANADGTATAVRKNVEVGEEVDYYTEITGGDLKIGDQLIYDHTYSIVEGQVFAPEQMYSEQSLGGMTEGASGSGAAASMEVE